MRLARYLSRLLVVFGGGLAGCTQDQTTPDDAIPAPDPAVHRMVAQSAASHGLTTREENGWLLIGESALPLRIASSPIGEGETTVQLTVIARIPDGRLLVRPVIGYGTNREEAMASAQADFLLGTFHTLTAAFCNDPTNQVERVAKSVGGQSRNLYLGNTVAKTNAEAPSIQHGPWREQFFAALEQQALPPGTHWVDVYHGYFGEEEVLQIDLDNAPWPAMQSAMAGAPWPKAGDFLGVRQLIIIDP